MTEEKRRVSLTLPKALVDEVEQIAVYVTKERGKICTKSELAYIALTSFVVGYYNEKPKTKEE